MTKRIRSFKRWLDRTYKKLLPKVTADSELAIMVNENEDPEIIAYLTEQHFPFYLHTFADGFSSICYISIILVIIYSPKKIRMEQMSILAYKRLF